MTLSPAKTHLLLFIHVFQCRPLHAHSLSWEMTNTSITRSHSKIQIALITPPTHKHLMLYSETSAQWHPLMYETRAARYCSSNAWNTFASSEQLFWINCLFFNIPVFTQSLFFELYYHSVCWEIASSGCKLPWKQ